MPHTIKGVDPGSIAWQLGIRPGDALSSINGEAVCDLIDYQALTANERIVLSILRGAELLEIAFEKDEYESLGIEFESAMMSPIRRCANRCVFCFVDQLPQNMRPTMNFKDDDWRMSLMMGNYVTLTNVSDRELERIVRRRASPLYISVHATDGELRAKLLGQPRGAKLMEQLRTLADGGLQFHCQAVLCPGLNDGAALKETIATLSAMHPAAQSLALVPVGLTQFRAGLADVRRYTAEEARAVLEIAEKWQGELLRRLGTRFVFPSDEFYVEAGMDVPEDDAYEAYDQLGDGVGMLRLLKTEFEDAYWELPGDARTRTAAGRKIAIATGVSAGPFFEELTGAHPIAGADVRVHALVNNFFGHTVTVAGLITGGDLVAQMRGADADVILITVNMLRDEGDKFLDDMTLAGAQTQLGVPIIAVGRRGDELLGAIIKQAMEE